MRETWWFCELTPAGGRVNPEADTGPVPRPKMKMSPKVYLFIYLIWCTKQQKKETEGNKELLMRHNWVLRTITSIIYLSICCHLVVKPRICIWFHFLGVHVLMCSMLHRKLSISLLYCYIFYLLCSFLK